MKVNLVLEGGGMRGAYSAGALSWLIDQGLVFDEAFAISTGAVHLVNFLLKDKKALYKLPCEVLPGANSVGLSAIRKEGQYVAFNYIFNDILEKQEKLNLKALYKHPTKINIGLYDLIKGACVYFHNQDLSINLLKAACSLPIVTKIVTLNNRPYLDGGISTMIPIEASIKQGNQKHLVICTKHAGYVRKKSPFINTFLMKLLYPKYPSIYRDYQIRADNYNKQMSMIEELVQKQAACLIRPSKNLKVKRFKGDPESLKKLYDLGYSDMEANKQAILALFK